VCEEPLSNVTLISHFRPATHIFRVVSIRCGTTASVQPLAQLCLTRGLTTTTHHYSARFEFSAALAYPSSPASPHASHEPSISSRCSHPQPFPSPPRRSSPPAPDLGQRGGLAVSGSAGSEARCSCAPPCGSLPGRLRGHRWRGRRQTALSPGAAGSTTTSLSSALVLVGTAPRCTQSRRSVTLA
jgi:hypothetical protein